MAGAPNPGVFISPLGIRAQRPQGEAGYPLQLFGCRLDFASRRRRLAFRGSDYFHIK